MTRKDYVAIAKAIDEVLRTCEAESAECSAVVYVATLVADVMQSDNARFNREQFLKACGI